MASSGYTLAHPADLDGETSYTFTCGKIDAGIAVLIGSHAHLIEFPSLLLPPGCEPGSIVSITCARDHAAEKAQADAFWDLQTQIINQFGVQSPQPPNLRLRSVTQTSVTLEWDKLELAQCKLLSLSIWKNGQRLGTPPNPMTNTSTKLSGLDLDTEYNFHLVMKTTGGTFNSQKVTIKTHSLNDTSGINVCFGIILPEQIKDQSKDALEQLNGRWSDKIQIDTTHFVCTMPYHPQHAQNKSAQPNTFPSLEYQRALQLSIPVVQPSWLLACLNERKMVPIAAHYLGAQPPPLNSTPSTTSSAGASERSRSGSKATAYSASNPISPKTLIETSSSPPLPQATNSRPHSRANSAPTSLTISPANGAMSPHQTERSIPGLEAISEAKDIEPSADPVVDSNTDPVEFKSYRPQFVALDSNSGANGISTKSRGGSLKLATGASLPFSPDQPNVPTPPRSSNLSDILKENVDSPADNDLSLTSRQLPILPHEISNPPSDFPATQSATTNSTEEIPAVDSLTSATAGLVNLKLAADHCPEEEQTLDSLTGATSHPKHSRSTAPVTTTFTNSKFQNDGLLDDGEDDPFSAASPTISNPSPLPDEIGSGRSSVFHDQKALEPSSYLDSKNVSSVPSPPDHGLSSNQSPPVNPEPSLLVELPSGSDGESILKDQTEFEVYQPPSSSSSSKTESVPATQNGSQARTDQIEEISREPRQDADDKRHHTEASGGDGEIGRAHV